MAGGGVTPSLGIPVVTAVVVCTANICRSPAVAFMAGRENGFNVSSAGMRARPGSAICPAVSLEISAYDQGAEYADAFRSQLVQQLELSTFDLVLTATRVMRGELVRTHPLLRDRIFTVREAVALAQHPLTSAEASALIAHGPAPIMAARRGTRAHGHVRGDSRWSRSVDPLDLPDAHNDRRARRHSATIGLSVVAGAELGAALQAWRMAAPGAALSEG